jgi:acyl carrier protein
MPTDARIDQVKSWLLRRKPELQETDLDLDLDLIENRVIDSLGFIDFVFFLEELTGRELQANTESVNSFRTLRAIQEDILQVGG